MDLKNWLIEFLTFFFFRDIVLEMRKEVLGLGIDGAYAISISNVPK